MLSVFCLILSAVAVERPWVVVNEDGNTSIAYHVPTLDREGLRHHFLKNVYSPHLTHYFINPQGMCCGYDTKVGEPVWSAHPGLDPAPEDIKKVVALHEKGIDPYAVWIEVAREKGVSPWISMRMNDVHCLDREKPCSGYVTKMWLDHPEWRRKADFNRNMTLGAFNYAVKEVFDYHLALAREMMERYQPDGFECDWLRFPYHLPPGRAREMSGVLTEFMRQIRRMANEIGEKRGRTMSVCARAGSTPESSLSLGLDAETWLREGLVDVLAVGNFYTTIYYDTPWDDWKRLVKHANPKVKLLASVDDGIYRTPRKRDFPNLAEIAGYYDVAYAKGIEDGIYIFNWFLNQPRHPVCRFIVDTGATPEAVASVPRTYAVTFRDAVDDGRESAGQFPMPLDYRREIAITVGRPQPGDAVTVRVTFDTRAADVAEKGLAALSDVTLNGFRATSVNGNECAFPREAVKSGSNVFAIGPKPRTSVIGLSLTLTTSK